MIKRCDKGNLHSFSGRKTCLSRQKKARLKARLTRSFQVRGCAHIKSEEMNKFACETDDESALKDYNTDDDSDDRMLIFF